jgi:MerR family transcriptional regulator, light-induced transcriptional regulator
MSAVFEQVQADGRQQPVGSRGALKYTTPVSRWLFGPAADEEQETQFMSSGSARDHSQHSREECEPLPSAWSQAASSAGSAWPTALAERSDAKARLSKLAQALESEVIPRLIGAHAKDAKNIKGARAAAMRLEPREIEGFVALLRNGSDAELGATVSAIHRRGFAVEAIFLELFSPAARYLGELWVADRCDFSTVTICLGRLQRLLREWSPAFGTEVEHPANGRRILLAQHTEEQHSFGLSMVAEFFRRAGWEVLGGVGGAVPDPSAQVSREWFDAVGFSIGSETRIDWLKERIAQVRKVTRNRSVVVLVGGPLFVLQPAWAQSVGADASGHDGGQAPKLAEDLLATHLVRR